MAREDFIAYYKTNLNLPENEFKELLECLETKLPQSFRIIDSVLSCKVKELVEKMPSIRKVKPVRDTYEIDKSIEENEFNKNFIINQTLVGTIQRQEIVSMIPILLMGLEKNHYVLDLCAAPGSKTKQILNIVDGTGLVIANDQNSKRLNILLTETFKIPNESFIATQYDASLFPTINFSNGKKFDRVFCDVPCSSDGTIRKNPALLKDWTKRKGEGLFDLQYRILKRSIDLVEDNGIIVYSTCSLNLLENECVVQNIVMNEGLEVVDPFTFVGEREDLKSFLKRRGLTSWNITDYKHKYLSVKPVKDDIGLDKCIRIYPFDNNTGGFFIALLRKRSKLQSDKPVRKNESKRSAYKEVPLEEKTSILDNYKLRTDINLVRRIEANNILYRISDEVKYILFNNKLKVVYAGYKYFEKCNINETGFRIKNVLYDKDLEVDLEFKACEIRKAIVDKVLDYEYPKKSVIIKLTDLNVCVSGWSTGKKIMLYVCNNLQKALLNFTN